MPETYGGNGGTFRGGYGSVPPASSAMITPITMGDVLTDCEHVLGEALNAVDELEKRLAAVLQPVGPSTTAGPPSDALVDPGRSQGYQRLIGHRDGLRFLVGRLQQLTMRIET